MGSEQKHVRCRIVQDGAQVECVGFSMADSAGVLENPADLLVQVGTNEWNGRISLQTVLRSASPSKDEFARGIGEGGDEILRDFLCQLLYNSFEQAQPAPEPARIGAPWALRAAICRLRGSARHFRGTDGGSPGACRSFIHRPETDARVFLALWFPPLWTKALPRIGASCSWTAAPVPSWPHYAGLPAGGAVCA
jgi:hypothetical protein